jgi:hypothetical protein
MRSFSQILILLAATLWLNACSNGESTPIATSTATSTSSPAPTATPTTKTEKNPVSVSTLTGKSIFKPAPTTPNSQSKVAKVSAALKQAAPSYGLIATTDKSRRQKELLAQVDVQSKVPPNNRDPFAPLPGTIPEPPLPPLPARPPLPLLRLPARPQPIAASPSIPYVPPQPKLREAETVTITGTVEIAGQRYAILSVPGDVTSQYVRAGQRIAGNKILVKSIETFGTPRVVLQQNGVEFTRYIK